MTCGFRRTESIAVKQIQDQCTQLLPNGNFVVPSTGESKVKRIYVCFDDINDGIQGCNPDAETRELHTIIEISIMAIIVNTLCEHWESSCIL